MGTEEFYGPRKGKKCVIYVRVSTERQVQGYSLDGQFNIWPILPSLRAWKC